MVKGAMPAPSSYVCHACPIWSCVWYLPHMFMCIFSTPYGQVCVTCPIWSGVCCLPHMVMCMMPAPLGHVCVPAPYGQVCFTFHKRSSVCWPALYGKMCVAYHIPLGVLIAGLDNVLIMTFYCNIDSCTTLPECSRTQPTSGRASSWKTGATNIIAVLASLGKGDLTILSWILIGLNIRMT